MPVELKPEGDVAKANGGNPLRVSFLFVLVFNVFSFLIMSHLIFNEFNIIFFKKIIFYWSKQPCFELLHHAVVLNSGDKVGVNNIKN